MALRQCECYRCYYRRYQSDCFKNYCTNNDGRKISFTKKRNEICSSTWYYQYSKCKRYCTRIFTVWNLIKKNELTLRSTTAFIAGKKTTEEYIQQFIKVKNRTGRNPVLRAVCIKFMLDGVIESHTAPMLEPFIDATADDKNANNDFALPLATCRSLLYRSLSANYFSIFTESSWIAARRLLSFCTFIKLSVLYFLWKAS